MNAPSSSLLSLVQPPSPQERPSRFGPLSLDAVDRLVRLLTALAVDEARHESRLQTGMATSLCHLALPWTPTLLDFLDDHADHLAEHIRPESGPAHLLLDTMLLTNYRSDAVHQVLSRESKDRGSSHVVSLLRLLRMMHRQLSRSRAHTGDTEAEHRFAASIHGCFEEMRSNFAELAQLRLWSLNSARPGERGLRVSLSPLGGSLTESTTQLVPWGFTPDAGELVAMGEGGRPCAPLFPWIVLVDSEPHLLDADPRSDRIVHRPPAEGTGMPHELDTETLAARVFPAPISADEFRQSHEEARELLRQQSHAIDDRVIGQITEGDVKEGSVLSDGFRLERQLSRGSVSAVYEATELSTGQLAIVKVLIGGSPRNRDQYELEKEGFQREAEAMASVRHPSIPRLLHDGTRNTTPFLAIEGFESRSLRDILSQPAPLGPERAIPIVLQLARALNAIHEAGIIHRDVKPENVLLGHDDHLLLIDFGLARPRAADGIMVEDIGGTIPYCPPEALDGGVISRTVDVFALGCILFELLSGKCLFEGRSEAESEARIRKGQREPEADLAHPHPTAIYDVVWAATEPDTKRRLPDVDMFITFLEKAHRGERPTPQRKTGGFLSRLFTRGQR